MNAIPLAEAATRAVTCDVVAHARLRVPWSGVADLRRQSLSLPGGEPPASLLKHAEDQTIVALAALSHAIRDHGLEGTDFSDWAVLATPRYPGRAALVPALARFRLEGAWGMSPHVIPHRSLHSMSGTVSHILKTHGPNFGVAGSPGSCAELFLNAGALLASGQAPAVWLFLTRVEPEAELDAGGTYLVPVDIEAAALALVHVANGEQGRTRSGLRLTLTGADSESGPRPLRFGLPEVLDLLDEAERGGSAQRRLPDGGRIEVRRPEDRR